MKPWVWVGEQHIPALRALECATQHATWTQLLEAIDTHTEIEVWGEWR